MSSSFSLEQSDATSTQYRVTNYKRFQKVNSHAMRYDELC